VTSLSVTLYGGTGGTNNLGEVPGGDGAEVNATLTVSPDQVLGVDVAAAVRAAASTVGQRRQRRRRWGGATDVTSGGSIQLVAGGGGAPEGTRIT